MTSPVALALLERHRREQAKIGQASALETAVLFSVLTRGGNLEANTPLWIRLMIGRLGRQRAMSSALSVQFHRLYTRLETGEEFVPQGFPLLDVKAFTTSLSVLGPTAYRREVARQVGIDTRDLTPQILRENLLPPALTDKIAANTARAASRHVLDGGREVGQDVIINDPRSVGYVRVTREKPCFFCALLASRGPVYVDDSFADSDPRFSGPGNAKIHDGCGCSLRPLYSRDTSDFLPRVREYEALWKAHRNLTAFRQAYEGREVKQAR